MTTRLLLLLLACLSFSAQGEVINKGENGFNLKITGIAHVKPETAYEQFIKVSDWWVENHTWFGKGENLSIDARAGGCFCEIEGDKEVLHMLVTFVNPGEEIKMVGGLGPLQMMGIHGGMSWRFEPVDNGTLITQTYNVSGYASGGLLDLADIVDAVQTGQLNALVNHLNNQ